MCEVCLKFPYFENLKIEHPVRYIWIKWLLIVLMIILVIVLALFILIFVVFPLVFKFSIGLQRILIFSNFERPKNPKFDKPQDYGFEDVTNFYITSTVTTDLNSSDVISLGAWWIPQESYLNSSKTMEQILKESEYPVLLYNHGVITTRIRHLYIYGTLRKFFNIVAIDYRDYGDSTKVGLTEDGVVIDVVHTYFLMKSKTKSDIYVWGHSLGGAISTHAVKWLKDNYNEIPGGLVVESSFTTLQDEVYEFFLAKIFEWLPWFEWCLINPIHANGFIFNTTRNIQDVDCPIMFMHAKDDPVIPFFLGEKNYEHTKASRKLYQGNVSAHWFPAEKGYGHVGCTKDPAVPGYISEFIQECNNWKRNFRKNV